MMEVCIDLLETCMRLSKKLPNAEAALEDSSSTAYSINYVMQVVGTGLLKAMDNEGTCPKPVMAAMNTLLGKALKDLEERIGIEDTTSVGYAIHVCVSTIKNYIGTYKLVDV
jgi:hypothetical protein